MRRELPKPWQWKNRNNDWYITVTEHGKRRQIFLAPNGSPEQQVRDLAVAELAKARVETGQPLQAGLLPVMEEYLKHVQRTAEAKVRKYPEHVRNREKKARRTFRIRRRDLHGFAQYLNDLGLRTLLVKDLQPRHVHGWLARHQWRDNTVRSAINSVQACLNWAEAEGYIDRNPLHRKLKRPAAESRGHACYLPEDLTQALLAVCTHECQRELFIALHQSGVRPCELVSVEARHFEQGKFWRVWGKATKNRPGGERLVGLTPQLVEVSQRLAARYPHGPLFRNTKGTAWTEATAQGLFQRLRGRLRRLGHDVPDLATPYALRHTFTTNRLGDGWSGEDLAKQMGNTPEVINKHYNHRQVKDVVSALQRVKPLAAGIEPPPGCGDAA
jgi:site-specific recombinase XerD